MPSQHTALARKMVTLSSLLLAAPFLHAQDTRTVTEPAFPTLCTALPAQLSIVAGFSGSVGGAPSSQIAFDTTRIQNALTACTSGHAVELSASGTNYAFLTQPLTIPTGVTLLIDPGVTLFGSLNPADYQISGANTCGTLNSAGGGCMALINVTSTTGSGVMGYGVINGQSLTPLVNSSGTQLPNSNSYADCPSTYLTWYCMSYTGRNVNPHMVENNPKLLSALEAASFTVYKTTFLNSPYFNIYWVGGDPPNEPESTPPTSGLTVWGAKILAPQQYENTDGIDPEHNVENISIINTYISNGDDNIALDADDPGFPLKNVTINNLHGYAGFGLSIGSETGGGLSNILYENIFQSGNTAQGLGMGLHIKSDATEGGLVNNVTYNGVCMRNENYPINILPFQGGDTAGSNIPHYTNITIENFTSLGGGVNGFVLQGHDSSNITTLTMSNVTVNGTPNFTTAPSDDSHAVTPENLQLTIGPYQVPAAFANLQTTYGSNGVTVTGTTTTTTPFACTTASFPPLAADLFEQTATATNLQTATSPYPGTITLNAVLEPTTLESPALANTTINFYEGTTLVGTGTLKGNGTFASTTLTGVAVGTHTYTAQYPADSNYAAFPFGSVSFTVTAAPSFTVTSSPTSLTLNPGASGNSTLTITPYNGFTGAVAIACSSPVAYVTCSVTTPPSITGTSAVSATATINLAATYGHLILPPAASPRRNRTDCAIALPFAALLLIPLAWYNRRATLRLLPVILLLATISGLTSCGGSSSNAGGGSSTTPVATTTTLAFSPTTIYDNATITLNSTVTAASGTPTGAVSFLNGTTVLGSGTLSSGAASFALAGPAKGIYSITSAYPGNSSFAASSSAAQTLTVVSPPPPAGIQTITFTATGTGNTVLATLTVNVL